MSQKSSRHYATDWVFRYSSVTGIVRYVFVAIAQFMKGSTCETPPTSVEEIRDLTGLGESTIRRGIKAIEHAGDLKIVRADRRGTVHKYALAKEVRLPLDADPPHRSERAVSPVTASGEIRRLSPVRASGVAGQSERCQRSVRPVSVSGEAALDPSLDLSTKDLSTSTNPEHIARAQQFLAWFVEQYPTHRNGARGRADRQCDLSAACKLLDARSLARVEAMAIEMWTHPDDWMRTTDFSVSVLLACELRLEAAVIDAEQRAVQHPAPATVLDALLRQLDGQVNRDALHRWFRPLRLVDDSDTLIVVEAPTAQHADWLRRHYADALQAAVSNVRPGAGLELRVASREALA